MKKFLVLLIIVLLAFGSTAFAKKKMVEVDDDEDSVTYDNCITTNVWPWVVGFYNIGYERMLGSNISIRPRVVYFGLVDIGSGSIFTLGADLFFHPMNKGIEGWYVGPRYDVWVATGEGVTGMMHFVGGMGGYKFVFEGGFTFGIALGVQINIANSLSYEGESSTLDAIGGTLPAFDAELGWSF